MPKGVPAKGFRVTRKFMEQTTKVSTLKDIERATPVRKETDDQIRKRQKESFGLVEKLTTECVLNNIPSVIFSGPPGVGKTFGVRKTLKKFDVSGKNHTIISGYMKPTGLFETLYNRRAKNNVIVLDDIDNIFFDPVGLNILKAVCDSHKQREVSWLSKSVMFDEYGMAIPKQFVFEGALIFLTNLDFQGLIDTGNRLSPHLSAIMSRSLYVDLGMRTNREKMIRIHTVVDEENMLRNHNLNKGQQKEVMDFVEEHVNDLRELSLRSVDKIARLRSTSATDWKRIAKVTCCVNP